ncbi:MAG TPA: hypothetical protein VF549_17740 [Solirubrobacteraceae bacterium]|jgi:hypothetical protein
MSLPIACSLTAAELPDRLREIASIGRDALLDARVAPGRATLRFAARPGIRDRLDALVAAESACCAFLTFEVREDDAQIVLDIRGPEEGQLVLGELAGAFLPGALRRAA